MVLACVWVTAAATDAPALRALAGNGVSERVATDPLSGIAIYGYDPVAYYLEGRPVSGSRAHELTYAGVVWRFASEANREAFRRTPEVFVPAYGGYDSEGIVRGVATAADPTIFAMVEDRLFLFRSEAAKERFISQDGASSADTNWPKVAAGLRP